MPAWLRAFDDAWGHAWESLSAALKDVQEDEAAWQHPAYAEDTAEAGWPAPGSVAWHVAHVAHCKRHYTDVLDARATGEPVPVSPRTPVEGFAAEQEALAQAHEAQRVALAALAPEDATRILGTGSRMRLDAFVDMMIRHDVWHAAQIMVARRLWRTR